MTEKMSEQIKLKNQNLPWNIMKMKQSMSRKGSAGAMR